MVSRTDGWLDEWMTDRGMDVCMDQWMDGQMGECMDGWMDGCIGGWMGMKCIVSRQQYIPCQTSTGASELHDSLIKTLLIKSRESRVDLIDP